MMIDKTNYTVCRLKIIFSYVSLIKIKLKQVFKPTNNKRIIAHVTSLPNIHMPLEASRGSYFDGIWKVQKIV